MTVGATTTPTRRWAILAMGFAAQAAGSVFALGLPYVLPQLRKAVGGSLASAALLAACPSLGLMLTLVLWGWIADVKGERLTIAFGLLTAGLLLLALPLVHTTFAVAVLLILTGAAAASVNAASGRVVMGWFAAHERGLAMGIRQTAQPLGAALAAFILPSVAERGGYQIAMMIPASLCLLVGVIAPLVIIDPPRIIEPLSERPPSPYCSSAIWRIHGASGLLIVPQFTIAVFGFVYLVDVQHLSATIAGVVLALTQVFGAAARLAAGRWSDVMGTRIMPMRLLALLNAIVMAALAIATLSRTRLSVPLIIAAAVVTVSGNGLAFTSVAEVAGSSWAGRALGVQNTVQNAVAFVTPAVIGALITRTSYGSAFLAVIAFPLIAAFALPRLEGIDDMRLRRGTRAGTSGERHTTSLDQGPVPTGGCET